MKPITGVNDPYGLVQKAGKTRTYKRKNIKRKNIKRKKTMRKIKLTKRNV